jgi:hypothetical protein
MQEILKKLPKDIVKISVGYNEPNEEWPVDIIDVDEDYSSGQLSITTVAALMNRAKLTVCPVGYATLMSIAVKGKCLSVFGGHVGPSHIYDSRMDLRNHRYVAPDPFCDCFDLLHGCHKDINIDEGVVKMKELLNA